MTCCYLDPPQHESYNCATKDVTLFLKDIYENILNPTSLETIEQITTSASQELSHISDLEKLEEWRVSYLGRRGKLTSILRGLSELGLEERKNAGNLANKSKALLEQLFEQKQQTLATYNDFDSTKPAIDVTLPGRPILTGKLHPTTSIVLEITRAFENMGFSVVEGPEVELDHYNFEMLNIPSGHPARDMWNSLWINQEDENGDTPFLLRTHTSPMQARVMESTEPPIRVIVPGKCYRYEATDATHEWHFYQIEGLAVDEGITFANLKGTLYEFARRMFGEDRKIRFRCDYFPFVEPGVDVSIDCFSCDGTGSGCRICRDTGWIEIMGAGMVHPKVLSGAGYDTDKYTGFAFGMGPERIAMLKYGIDDIRHFYSNDLRFLQQF
ncbi:MAG: phenylalanine--tRNA ligase subunit alpha [Dehalococcoidia bacterium]|nr:phenylalanine--tRNA ligase subunit alpha [Dehalococcoidia bacterium]